MTPIGGNSVVDYALGEECDDGATMAGDGCDPTCRIEPPAHCGDGSLDLNEGEQCDDSNTAPGDGCSPSCQFETVGTFCGDATIDANEVCDDANTNNGDGCNPTCNFANTTTVFAGQLQSPGLSEGAGTAAQIGGPGVLAADDTHLWFADGVNRVVRRVEVATANVQTIAGTGNPGNADNANGLSADFGSVEAITTDGANAWVASAGRIRQISATPPHAVTTVAGQASGTYAAGTGTSAVFDDLRGLTYYDGLIYFVDANAAVLGSFHPGTGEVKTLAGTAYTQDCPGAGKTPKDGVGAAATFCSPRYMSSDNSGNLYVADTNGNSLRKFNTVTGEVTTFAGTGMCGYVDGLGAAAAVHRPRGMTSDGTSIYWVEFDAHTIRQGIVASQSVSTMIGTPPACAADCSCGGPTAGGYLEAIGAAAVLDNPFGIAYHFPSKSLFFVDSGNAVLRRIR